MSYLLQAFMRKMESYKFLNTSITDLKDGSHEIYFTNTPPELEAKLLKLKFISKDRIHRFDGDDEIITAEIYCCIAGGFSNKRWIKAVFDDKYGCQKLNMIAAEIERYAERVNKKGSIG